MLPLGTHELLLFSEINCRVKRSSTLFASGLSIKKSSSTSFVQGNYLTTPEQGVNFGNVLSSSHFRWSKVFDLPLLVTLGRVKPSLRAALKGYLSIPKYTLDTLSPDNQLQIEARISRDWILQHLSRARIKSSTADARILAPGRSHALFWGLGFSLCPLRWSAPPLKGIGKSP